MLASRDIVDILVKHKNVILTGPPASGKSTLLNQVAELFESGGNPSGGSPDGSGAHPSHDPEGGIPIPDVSPFPFDDKKCKVFRTTFHQNYKNRDFISGIVPSFTGPEQFDVNRGILYEANEFAKKENSAALLIIDEINRGPAVEIFGGSLVAIEADKRLSETGGKLPTTQYFSIASPEESDKGKIVEYALSPNLYILAAMNQADTSIASFDTAFLRRWFSIFIDPDYDILYREFKIKPQGEVPEKPESASDVYRVAFMALERINERITVGLGSEYQIGHGVFFGMNKNPEDVPEALNEVLDVWYVIFAQLDELFFNQASDLAFVLNASSVNPSYRLESQDFNNRQVDVLRKENITVGNVYSMYKSILGN